MSFSVPPTVIYGTVKDLNICHIKFLCSEKTEGEYGNNFIRSIAFHHQMRILLDESKRLPTEAHMTEYSVWFASDDTTQKLTPQSISQSWLGYMSNVIRKRRIVRIASPAITV